MKVEKREKKRHEPEKSIKKRERKNRKGQRGRRRDGLGQQGLMDDRAFVYAEWTFPKTSPQSSTRLLLPHPDFDHKKSILQLETRRTWESRY